ncbi:MAG: hypothetical protein V2A74_13195 [bacterium]
MSRKILFMVVVMSLAAGAQATQLIQDDFSYTLGDLDTQGSWALHSGTTALNVVSTNSDGVGNSLETAISGYPVSAGNHIEILSTNSKDLHKDFTAQLTGDGQSIYAGMLVKVTTLPTLTGTYPTHFILTGSTTTFPCRLFVKQDADTVHYNFGLTLTQTATPTFESTLRNVGQTYLIVYKLTTVAGVTNDTCALYVDPTDFTTEGNNSTAITYANTGSDTDVAQASGIGRIGFRQAAGEGTIQVDSVRVGNTWTDAVPVELSIFTVE